MLKAVSNQKLFVSLLLLSIVNSFYILPSSSQTNNLDEYFNHSKQPSKVPEAHPKTEVLSIQELETQDFERETEIPKNKEAKNNSEIFEQVKENNKELATEDNQELKETLKKDKFIILHGEIISIGSGASFSSTADRAISSNDARVGDRFFVKSTQNIESIPAGSTIEIVVDNVKHAKRRFSSPGSIELRAIRIVTEDGRVGDIQGKVFLVTDPSINNTVLKGSTAKERLIQTGARTGTGAAMGGITGASGAVIGGSSSAGEAALIGLGVGAIAGVLTAGLQQGKEITIEAGSNMYLKFMSDTQIIMRE